MSGEPPDINSALLGNFSKDNFHQPYISAQCKKFPSEGQQG
jgi:hypothetical protein